MLKKTTISAILVFLLALPLLYSFSGTGDGYNINGIIGYSADSGTGDNHNISLGEYSQPTGTGTGDGYNILLGYFWAIKAEQYFSISGNITFAFPGWTQPTAEVDYQLREHNTTNITSYGSLILNISNNASTFILENIPNGIYDLAFKHSNHVADMVSNITLESNVIGLEFLLWAGDSDGNDNAYDVEPGDNDVDLKDYYVLYYQYQGYDYNVSAGEGADFDGNGEINLNDYYGLYYGYQNNPYPGNWY